MANAVWTWFKKIGHYIGIGMADANKFVTAVQESGILSIVPGGGLINSGIGVFEKVLAGTQQVEIAYAATNAPNALTGPQKLLAATPSALQALQTFVGATGLKITDPAKFQAIATTLTGLAADFWNIVEPVTGSKLPAPNVPAAPTPLPTPTTVA